MLTSALAAPACPTPVEEIAAAIDQLAQLHGLPLEDRLWLARNGRSSSASAGDILFEEGAPAEQMMLILKGEIHVRRQRGGPMALFIGRTGQMTGLLALLAHEELRRPGLCCHRLLGADRSQIPVPRDACAIPSMGQRVVSTLLDRVREVTRIEQQAEKLTALGKLAGNLAHELNNPASAAQRAAASLVTELRANRQNRFKLVNLCLSQAQIEAIEDWEQKIFSRRRRSPSTSRPPT